MKHSLVLQLTEQVHAYDTFVGDQLERSVEELLTEEGDALKVHYLFPQRTKVVTATNYVKRKLGDEGFIGHLKNVRVYELTRDYAVRRREVRGANGRNHQVKVYVHKIEMISSVYGDTGDAFALLTCDVIRSTHSVVAWAHVEVFVADNALAVLRVQNRQSFFQWRVEIARQMSEPLVGGLTSL